jgi:pdz/dhr/glgf protein
MVHHSRVNPTRKRLVSGSLFAILTLVGLAMPGAYVVETAGPAPEITGAQDGVDLLTLTGGKTYGTQTKYYMTTVSSYGNSDFGVVGAQAFAAIFSRDSQVLPVRSLYPAGQTADQVDKRNTALMGDSQQAAASTAETAAGLPVRMRIGVAGVPKGSPAAGRLREGDLVTRITANGVTTQIAAYADLGSVLKKTPPGTTVNIGFTRDGKAMDADVTTSKHEPDSTGWTKPGSRLGLYLKTSDVKLPIAAKYGVEGIGGPSAGLMFALTIYDRATPGSLGGKARIAGTGTISLSGDVGPIGGIPHKLEGAAATGARHFLAPAENCAETVGYEPEGMRIYAVRTFDEALTAVRSIGAGKTDELTTCSDVVKAGKAGK